MTKNILILALFIFSFIQLNAQCTPDNMITKPGFYPAVMPDAQTGVAYNQVIQFKFIKDTTVIVFGNPTVATIDSMTIMKVNNLPDGLTFQLNKSKPTYTPAEVGCAKISGTPTKAGTFKLNIIITIYYKLSGFGGVPLTDTIKNPVMKVNGAGGIEMVLNSSQSFYPNPLSGTVLNIHSDYVKQGAVLNVYSPDGRMILEEKLEDQTAIPFDVPAGVYWLTLSDGTKINRAKLIKH